MIPKPTFLIVALLLGFSLSGCVMDDEGDDETDDGDVFDGNGGTRGTDGPSDTGGPGVGNGTGGVGNGTGGEGNTSADQDGNETVWMNQTTFEPANLTIQNGTAVTWENGGALQHTVTSTDGGPLDSGQPGSADGYNFTFDEPGTYPYRCTVHSFQNQQGEWTGMVGEITVENETEAASTL